MSLIQGNALAFQNGETRETTWVALQAVLGISVNSTKKWKEDPTCPKSIGGVVDGKAVLEWICTRSTKGKGAHTRAAAEAILSKFQARGARMTEGKARRAAERAAKAPTPPPFSEAQRPPSAHENPPDQSTRVTLKHTGRGVTEALERLRDAELKTAQKYADLVESGDPDDWTKAAGVFRMWQSTLAELRKMETDVLDIEKKKGNLIPVDDAKRILAAQILPVRNKLLLLPAQLAPELENRDAAEIQALLSESFYTLLKDFSSGGADPSDPSGTSDGEDPGGDHGDECPGVASDRSLDEESDETGSEAGSLESGGE